jgi:hypothetical protein
VFAIVTTVLQMRKLRFRELGFRANSVSLELMFVLIELTREVVSIYFTKDVGLVGH